MGTVVFLKTLMQVPAFTVEKSMDWLELPACQSEQEVCTSGVCVAKIELLLAHCVN